MSDKLYFIKLRNQYLTLKPPRNNTMFLGFRDARTTFKCKTFIEKHKKKYGSWPSLNMDKDYETLSYEMDSVGTCEPLIAEQMTLEDTERMMRCSGVNVLYCHEFDAIPNGKTFTINFRAQELELDFDLFQYIKCLDHTLDSSGYS